MVQGHQPATTMMAMPAVLTANLPAAAASNNSCILYCPDAPGGPALMLSDGIYWRPFARGRQQKRVTTLAGGVVTWTYAVPYPAGSVPVASFMVENTTANPYGVEITSITNTAISIKVSASRPLPTLTALSGVLTLLTQVITGVNAIVTSLSGYSLFTAAGAGVVVHLSVSMPTE